jgi:predicted transcriptional regulator
MRLPFNLARGSRRDLGAFFGSLEVRVLDGLWRRGTPASVRDLQHDFPRTAYTTLMTTLDRLHRKGVLTRMKSGRAFLYEPRCSREELRLGLAEDALGAILGPGVSAHPMLSFFLEAVSRKDEALLDELERLVREKQETVRQERRGRNG